ncbi:FUSC family protein [Streptomyces sp. NPDC001156]
MGVPLAVGVATGHLSWGLTATMGAFTAVYATGEPYGRRAVLLAAAGAGFVLCVVAGSLVGGRVWLAAVMVGLVGAVAGYVCDALRTGAPGGYLFALACATSAGLPADTAAIGQRAVLTLSGAACVWLVAMSGALVNRRGPETAAVAHGYDRLVAYLSAIGGPRQDTAQHEAAVALRRAWYAVAASPQPFRRAGTVVRLRLHVRQAHHLFSAAIRAAAESSESIPHDLIDAVARMAESLRHRPMTVGPLPALPLPDAEPKGRRALRTQVNRGLPTAAQTVPFHDEDEPLEPSSAPRLLASGAARNSLVLPGALRVLAGAAVAGWVAHACGLPQSYWASGAAIVVLQGANVTTMMRRSAQRSVGTAAGVALAGGVLALHPDAPLLVAAVMLLQFAAETVMARNYALGVAFITPLSLLLTEAADPALPPNRLVTARLLDTACGCVIALIAGRTLWGRTPSVRLPGALAHALRAQGRAWELILVDSGDTESAGARQARHRLRTELIDLRTVAENAAGDPPTCRESELLWSAVVATQRIGYLAISVSRSLRCRARLTCVEARRVGAAFQALAAAVETGEPPSVLHLGSLGALPCLSAAWLSMYDSLGIAGDAGDNPSGCGPGPSRGRPRLRIRTRVSGRVGTPRRMRIGRRAWPDRPMRR